MSLFSHLARCMLPTMALLTALDAPFNSARADYPERQVTMIVCFPAGGGTDIAARLINTQLGEALGKPVIIEKIERDLMELVPRKDWTMFSHRMIFHGRQVCHARKPKCAGCTLAADCPKIGVEQS